ncbi:phage integrase N-terminal SAM-like domain-containing protein [Candidatus Pacearchaeota archaeon]|nr:phage integrase N-terminal SAM-like domain-containing protein [Candidatus Pacearchaeota archaeon]
MLSTIEDFKKTMAIKHFSPSTQKGYFCNLRKFLTWCDNEKREVDSQSFRDYLYGLIKIDKLSNAALKQSIAAVKFFFGTRLTSLTNLTEFPILKKRKSYQPFFRINKSFHYSTMPQI